MSHRRFCVTFFADVRKRNEENMKPDPQSNYEKTRQQVGYRPRRETSADVYAALGFRCGLEIHQQLKTGKKLFCRCPAGVYHDKEDFDAEVIRHMRPTLSELGEYDGTALMEFKTKKNIIYRIKNQTACTYEIDDTPPFAVDRESLDIAIRIALMLKTNIVGELHITRKQYLDGSIPTGFQRTAIVGIEGEIPLENKKVRIIQLSLEEDSCREVSDVEHWRVYTTDRLGMPLIETVTYPDMTTPDEAAEAGNYLRFLARSSGLVRTGIGAARQDVNVSITGGARVEIKGVAHIAWIPELTHNEAFRQKALLAIASTLQNTLKRDNWEVAVKTIPRYRLSGFYSAMPDMSNDDRRITAVNLPGFGPILSTFTQPGQVFADEISGRVKVVACLEQPNMLVSDHIRLELGLSETDTEAIRGLFKAGDNDAQIVVWGRSEDVDTAVETIQERCLMAFDGVPNETRKALPDGTTIFERVLPGPDRMYPDTDSAPIPIEDDAIKRASPDLPPAVADRLAQLRQWRIPRDTYPYLLRRNLLPTIERIIQECEIPPRFVGALLGHTLKMLEGRQSWTPGFSYSKVVALVRYVSERELDKDILKVMLPVVYDHPNMVFESVLTTIDYRPALAEAIYDHIPVLAAKFREVGNSKSPTAAADWIMGCLRKSALGNMPLRELRERVDREVNDA